LTRALSREKPVNCRAPFHDYREPSFYMVTMTALNRRPLFSVCADDRVTFTDDGRAIYRLWHDIPKTYPEIEPSTFVLMPDHLHGILRVTRRMEKPLGVPLRAFKAQATGALRDKHGDPALRVWEPGYHDHVLYSDGALKAFTRYLMDNPRRHCLKKANPDLFRRRAGLAHEALPPEQAWTAFGNRFLLDWPAKRALRVSRSATEAEIAALRGEVLREAANGAVVVSPFISPGEKAVALAILAAPKGSVVLMKHDGFPEGFKPKGRHFDLCAEGRLLILSCGKAGDELARERCRAMNVWCARIAQTAIMGT
jgi:hypothetical protein